MPNIKNGKIKIDNTSAYYVSFGEGKKNLIIIPGVGDGFKTVKGIGFILAKMNEEFLADYRVYIFSRRNKMPHGFTTEDMANDIIKHMEELKINKADVIGVSQGGMIAQYVAINAPERVNRLALTVTVARTNEILNTVVTDWIERAKKRDYKGIMVDFAEKGYVGKYLEKNRKTYKLLGLLGLNASYDRFIIEAESCLNHNAYDKLDLIECPTLIIGAEQDKILGIEGSKELAERIKNSELYIYKEYSHGVYEQAKDFNTKIYEFFKSETLNNEEDKYVRNSLLAYTFFNGLYKPCRGGIVVTQDRELYDYTFYSKEEDGQSFFKKVKDISDEEYKAIIKFINKEIKGKSFNYLFRTDGGNAIIVKHDDINIKNENDKKISSKVYELLEKMVEGNE